jgi:hypothetical protein
LLSKEGKSMMQGIDCLVVESTVKPALAPRLQRPQISALSVTSPLPWPAGVRWLVPALIGIGIVFRLVAYLGTRSLWLDEAMLAHNLIHRSWAELFQALDFNQAAPVGFLLGEKALLVCLGAGELVLRLGPLLAGIISLFLFLRVARHYLQPKAVPLALALFAAAPSLIYYASEVKQYSSDVFWVLLCYTAAISSAPPKWSLRAAVAWSVLGGVAVWFSFPVVFVLAGLATVWAGERVLRKDWLSLGKIGVVVALWLLSFAAYYFLLLRYLVGSDYLTTYWQGGFMPLPPFTQAGLGWLIDTFFQVLSFPVGLSFNLISLAGIGALVFVFGCIAFWAGKKQQLFLLLAPVALTLLASGLHKYPFDGRLLLFLVPAALLILAEGTEYVRSRTAAALPLLGIVIMALLLFGPAATSARALFQPRAVEEIRPVLQRMKEQLRANDAVYVYNAAWPAFAYYAPRLDFPQTDYRVGQLSRDDWSQYRSELQRLRGQKRVWVLFTHIHDEERQYFLSCLDEMGTRQESYTAHGAVVYLYDLSRPASRDG